VGPFKINPDEGKGTKLEIKLFSFCDHNLFDGAILDTHNNARKQALANKKQLKNFVP